MGQRIWMTVVALIACASLAQNGSSSQGEPALKTQFVAVQPDVKLEVLDWGGTGRNLVLLAGLGSTTHAFDSLGPKLAAHYHVVGITRRGFGQSSAPQTGYDARRLGDDVVAVLDALHIADPVLIGHSIAGEELSAISAYHPGRAAALFYLDAGGAFALYNPKHGDYTVALAPAQPVRLLRQWSFTYLAVHSGSQKAHFSKLRRGALICASARSQR